MFYNAIEAVYVHFSQPNKDKLLQDLQISMQTKSLSISRLCETRLLSLTILKIINK